jgi:branched-chain amino acid transport system substrate-binding protein
MYKVARAATFAAALTLAGTALAQEKTIVILQAQTGVGAFAGAGAAAGAKYAFDELNAKGFFEPLKVKVLVEDDGSDRNQATTAFSRYARDPGVLMVVGPTIAPTALAAGAVANEQKLAMMPLTNTPTVLATGPYAFLGSQPPSITVPHIAKYTYDKMGARNCLILSLSDNEAYVQWAKSFREEFGKLGGKITEETSVKSSDTDFSAISTRIVAAKPECIFFATNAPVGANLAAQLRQAGLPKSAKFIGQVGLSSPDLIKIAGAAVEDLVLGADWSAGGANDMGRALAANYKRDKGVEVDNWIAMGYSFMQVAAAAVKAAGPNPTREGVRDALAKTKDVPIVLGNGKYSYVGDRLPEYGVMFLKVKDGKFVLAE